MSEVQEQQEVEQESAHLDTTEVDQAPTLHLSTSICYLLVAGWLSWIAIYTNLTGTIFSLFLYGLALFSLFVSVGFFIGELRRTPQFRRFLAEILPLKDVLVPWRPTADIWTSGIILGVFCVLCVSVHFVAITWLGWTGILAGSVKAVVVVLTAGAVAIIYVAVDDHIIKPFLRFLSSNDESVQLLTQRIRKLVLALAGGLGFLATLLQINDYFR